MYKFVGLTNYKNTHIQNLLIYTEQAHHEDSVYFPEVTNQLIHIRSWMTYETGPGQDFEAKPVHLLNSQYLFCSHLPTYPPKLTPYRNKCKYIMPQTTAV